MKKPPIKRKKSTKQLTQEDAIKKLGERLKQVRIEKGYTSYENFAFEHELGRSQIGRYERGQDDLRFSTLLKVLNALDITLTEFFGEGFEA
ncbi:MAG TPA: helix-turn-helix transcriptional regulator [Bacteroidia bacterium]|nr:helix-turn-helix transcriptional regulator [Bacteroidia bacterium]